jgi:hypothetical protein
MKQTIARLCVSAVSLLSCLAMPVLLPQMASAQSQTGSPVMLQQFAQTPKQSLCQGAGGNSTGNGCSGGTTLTVLGVIQSVANILIFLTGAVSVLMIIIGGLRYALSGGDQSSITSAKNTILYAIIGAIVAIAAYAIVNFVLVNV